MIAVVPKEYGPDYSDRCRSFTRDSNARASIEDRCGACVSEGSCLFAEIMMLLYVMWSNSDLRRKPNPTGEIVDEFHEKCEVRLFQLVDEFAESTPVEADESSVNAPKDELYPLAEENRNRKSKPKQKARRRASRPKGKKQ